MMADHASLVDALRSAIRTVPDWPQPGVQFRDITPVLGDGTLFAAVVDALACGCRDAVDRVAGVEARGFPLAAALAFSLGVGFAPVRKQGKLPAERIAESYALEYGRSTLELHVDACRAGERVLLVDDLIATGGTLGAAARLVGRLGARVVECVAIVDLPALGGSSRLRAAGFAVRTLLEYPGH